MFDIMSLIPGRKKLSHSGWYSFNAVCCDKLGHRSDKRSRGGLKLDGNNWVMHCFNCGYSCSFTLGRSIGDKTKKFNRKTKNYRLVSKIIAISLKYKTQ